MQKLMRETIKKSAVKMRERAKKNPQKDILRYPRLDTVLMVERHIEKHSGDYKKRKLWETLPKKMMYQTYCVVIDYLQHSRKIGIDKLGYVVWVYNPEFTRKYLARPDLDWKER